MSRLFIEGFESGDMSNWTSSTDIEVVSSLDLNMSGDYAMKLTDSNSQSALKRITPSHELNINFRFRCRTCVSFIEYGLFHLYNFSFINSWMKRVYMKFRGNKIYIYNMGTPTELVSAEIPEFEFNKTLIFSLYCYSSNTIGRYILKCNGITFIDFSGDLTGVASISGNLIEGIGFDNLFISEYSPIGIFYIDDIIIDNAVEIPYQNRVLKLPYEVNSNEFNNIGGSDTECVLENDDKYIQTNTPGTRISLTFSDNQSIKTFYAIQPQILSQRYGNLGLLIGFNDGVDDIFEMSKVYPGWRSDDVCLLTETLSASGDYFNDKTIYIETE